MKNLLQLFTIIILLTMTTEGCLGKGIEKYGYLVCTTGLKQVNCKKVLTIKTVQVIFDHHFKGTCIDIKYELLYSNYYQILTENHGIYIEKKRLKKVRKNGKLILRKIRK